MNKIARFSTIYKADAVSLSALYEATSERTLAAWQQVPDCGEVMQNAHYDPHRLALATGIQPPLSGAIASLRQKLAALTGDDPLADCMPASGLHFYVSACHATALRERPASSRVGRPARAMAGVGRANHADPWAAAGGVARPAVAGWHPG